MTIGSTTGPRPLSHSEKAASSEQDPKLAKAAADFEALFVAQMLRSAREVGSGAFGGGDGDQSGSAIMEMAEDQLAQTLSNSGGLGLARTIADTFRTTTAIPRDAHGLKMAAAAAND